MIYSYTTNIGINLYTIELEKSSKPMERKRQNFDIFEDFSNSSI